MSSTTKTNNPIIVSVVAYLAFVGLIISYVLNKPTSELGSFHIRQALGIYLLFLVSGLVITIPILGWIAGGAGFLLGFILWLIGIVDAFNGQQKPVPVLGEHFQRWFQGL
ncbi:MAG: hypothetical protein AAFU67_06090 [Bacteroidota bacterium]